MKDKNKIYGILATVFFHAVVILILLFYTFTQAIPTELGGVLVQFGNIDIAQGTFEPENTTPPQPEETPETPQPVVESNEKMIIQESEETVALVDKETQKKEDKKKKEEEKKRIQEQEQRAEQKKIETQKKEKAANLVAGAFGAGTGNESSGNSESGTGNQGNPFGNSTEGNLDGVGGMGSYDLNGRSIGAEGLPTPSFQGNVTGKVVINITVDSSGKVIAASVGRGTTVDDLSLRNSSLAAARRARFNTIQEKNNQVGTITYSFKQK